MTTARSVSYTHLDVYKRQERVERYRVLVGVGEINPVLAVRAVVDKLGQPQVAVTRICLLYTSKDYIHGAAPVRDEIRV